jgi:hypothetical protein
MATQQGKVLILAGAGALLFMASGKKKRKKASSPKPSDSVEDLDADESPAFEPDTPEPEPHVADEEAEGESIISKYISPSGKAQLGGLYQIRVGDTPLEICREALFGSREPVTSQVMRQAAKDLLVRIDCGPWNQAVYGVSLNNLTSGHAAIDEYWTQQGVSLFPIYADNFTRMSKGLSASGAKGESFAVIWIPMINLDKFDMEGVVSTEGMYHPDTSSGQGGSMIDPPQEILDLGFDDVSEKTVGCDLPEGDFRKTLVAN